jgi:hypothetical protein
MSKESAMALYGAPTQPTTQAPPAVQESQPTPAETSGDIPTTAQPEPLKSQRFNEFAKKEAEIVRLRQQVIADRKELEEPMKVYKQFQDLRGKDPLGAMKLFGFTDTEIFNALAAQAPPDLTPEEKAIKAAEGATEARIKAFEDAQLKKEQEHQAMVDKQSIETFQSELGKTIQSNKEKFEYCAYYGEEAQDLAYELTASVFKDSKGKELLKPEEALQMAEDYYEEKDKAMSGIRKRQPVETKAPAPSTTKTPTRTREFITNHSAGPVEVQKPAINSTRTLTSASTSSMASMRQARNETKGQKRERLINKLRNGM